MVGIQGAVSRGEYTAEVGAMVGLWAIREGRPPNTWGSYATDLERDNAAIGWLLDAIKHQDRTTPDRFPPIPLYKAPWDA